MVMPSSVDTMGTHSSHSMQTESRLPPTAASAPTNSTNAHPTSANRADKRQDCDVFAIAIWGFLLSFSGSGLGSSFQSTACSEAFTRVLAGKSIMAGLKMDASEDLKTAAWVLNALTLR